MYIWNVSIDHAFMFAYVVHISVCSCTTICISVCVCVCVCVCVPLILQGFFLFLMCVVRICMFVVCVSVYLTACKPLMFEMHDIVSNIILFFNVLYTECKVIYYLIYIITCSKLT